MAEEDGDGGPLVEAGVSQCPVRAVPRPRSMPRQQITIHMNPGGPFGSPPGPGPAYLQAVADEARRRLMPPMRERPL